MTSDNMVWIKTLKNVTRTPEHSRWEGVLDDDQPVVVRHDGPTFTVERGPEGDLAKHRLVYMTYIDRVYEGEPGQPMSDEEMYHNLPWYCACSADILFDIYDLDDVPLIDHHEGEW